MLNNNPTTYIVTWHDHKTGQNGVYETVHHSFVALVSDMGQYDRADKIWRCDYDVPPRDVTEEVVRAYGLVIAKDYDQDDVLPGFLDRHVVDFPRGYL